MSVTTLLENGCPCTSATCERKGDCAACIKNHVEKAGSPTSCMREIVSRRVAEELEKQKCASC